MPIAKKKPHVEVQRNPLPVGDMLAEKKIYKTATADSAVNPPESLVLYMEGMPWTVTYYSQLLGEHDNLREVDTTSNAALQQYRKLNNIELRVQSELSQSYDEATGRNDVTGTAVAIGMIPNAYDYFVTDAGTQGRGLFMITSSTRKTYNNGSVYEIDYVLIGYTDVGTAKDRYTALEDRSVKEFYYHKERVQAGQVGLLTTQEHGDVGKLKLSYARLQKSYLELFTSQSDRLLIVPSSSYLYDPRASTFFLSTVDLDVAPAAVKVNRASVDRDPYMALVSIWTVIMERDIGMLTMAVPKVAKVSRSFFAQNSFLTTTNCWNVDEYVYPDTTAAQAMYTRLQGDSQPAGWLGNFEGTPIIPVMVPYADKTIPLIFEANRGGYYVLSEYFYSQDTANMSLLEILVTNYLRGEALNLNHLGLLAESWGTWGKLEKFYFTPLLTTLLKDAVAAYY